MARALSQTPQAKNGLEQLRDVAVVLATLSGAALSVYYIDGQKPAGENIALGAGAVALSAIGIITLLNDVA